MDILLSKVTTPVINWISELLGLVMNGIYTVLNMMGTEKVGFSILIYTVVVYMILLPITIRTQKQSKIQSYMQPEMTKVQKKYAGRRDTASQMAMQQDMQKIYDKYGFSPYGTCLPMIVQLVLLWGVYQVIYHIPGYVTKIGEIFTAIADKIMAVPSYVDAMTTFISENLSGRVAIAADGLTSTNIVDALYLLKPSQWTALSQVDAFSSISGEIADIQASVENVNMFMGMNISMSPWDVIQDSFSTGAWGFLFLAIAVPVLAWFTQWIGIKLQPSQGAIADSPMSGSLKSTMIIMPIFSAIICATLSLGVGIYWIAGAVIRAIQMVVINRRMMKVDMDEVIKKNLEKAAKRKAKGKKTLMERLTSAGTGKGENTEDSVEGSRLSDHARSSVRSVKGYTNDGSGGTDYSSYGSGDPDSMFAKVNMVNKYNETHQTGSKSGKNGSYKKKKK